MAKAETSEVHTGTEAHGGHDAGGAFPPFNAETFAPQLFWLALTFAALYLILSRIALPRIGAVIEERAERIQRDLDAAERLKNETDTAIASYEQALADARSNASSIASETREKVSAEIEAERTRVESDLAAKLEAAEQRITETRQKALANVDEIATDVAGEVVAQLTGTNASADEIRNALGATRS